MTLRRWQVARSLGAIVGGAFFLIAVLLYAAARWAAPVEAAVQPDQGRWSGWAAQHGGIRTAWTSTDPVTIELETGQGLVWIIPQYGVTITFQENSVYGNAVFTFTPKSDIVLTPPIMSTPYMFELIGIFKDTGGLVSLYHAIQIEFVYDESRLGVYEDTLEVYNWHLKQWFVEDATIDRNANSVSWETWYLGLFGLGGYRSRIFLPVVMKGAA